MNLGFLVTVAGCSTRFRQSAGLDVLKCLYHEGGESESLLHRAAAGARRCGADALVVVGGYRFADLSQAVAAPAFRELVNGLRFACVKNPHFEDRGSGESLYLGLRALLAMPGARDRQIVFMEGDLAVDADSLERLAGRPGDVLSSSPEPISALRSVCAYRTQSGGFRFAYDPEHRSLSIPEPFREVFNSGQVWKFADPRRLAEILDREESAHREGTNLGIVQSYFESSQGASVEPFARWHNCNTLSDYRLALGLVREEIPA